MSHSLQYLARHKIELDISVSARNGEAQIKSARDSACICRRAVDSFAATATACGAVSPPQDEGKEIRQRAVPGDRCHAFLVIMIQNSVTRSREHFLAVQGATATEYRNVGIAEDWKRDSRCVSVNLCLWRAVVMACQWVFRSTFSNSDDQSPDRLMS
eukprot:3931881-Rhodomonas_salina.1